MLLSSLWRRLLVACAALSIVGCGGGGSDGPSYRSGFLTADARGLSSNGTTGAAAPGASASDAADGIARAIEEADLYRVDGDRLYLLNSWRGLAVVDLATPALEGRLRTNGTPAEMFLRDTHAYVMLASFDGGTDVLDVSVADPASPTLVASFPLAGAYRTSRLAGDVLYVLTDTDAHSFRVTGAPTSGALAPAASLAIPGGVAYAHATDAFLFVAAPDDAFDTRVTLVDVSSPDGAMARRGSKTLPGYLSDEFKLHFGAGTLRVVTHDGTDGGLSHLFLLDVSAPDAPFVRGTLDLARGEQLFATRFTDDAAYVVTFERVDPLWVVDLRDPDAPVLAGSLVVPGWSTHLVALDGRLVALGLDPSDWHATASLYDVADPAHPSLSSRVDFGWGWSSAFYDVKGFGVHEAEGLVLVPFAGATNELAVLALGAKTLSLRGAIATEGTVLRGFPHARGLCALSTEEVVVANPSTLAPTGRVTVAEDVADVARLANGVRVEAVRRAVGCRVGGVSLPIAFGAMFPYGTSVAVTGSDVAGSAAYVLDFGSSPATVSPRLALGTAGFPSPIGKGWDAAMPGGGLWNGGYGALDGALGSDGRLALHARPEGVPDLAVGTGAVDDGFVVIDVPGARVETTIGVRGGFVTGFVADGPDLVFTIGSFAGDDRAGRPLLLHDLVRVGLASRAVAPAVNVPGYVVAAGAGRVFTVEETWGADWAYESAIVATDVAGAAATPLDRLALPAGAYDVRAAGGTLFFTTNGGMPVPVAGVGGSNGAGAAGGAAMPGMPGLAGMPDGPGGMPFLPTAEIGTVRLAAALSFGPTISYDADFASLLLAEDGAALVVRNGVVLDRWDVAGASALLLGSTDLGAWPQSARPDATPGAYLLALGFGGVATAP